MRALVYIETNFLMSFAEGRDPATRSLLVNPPMGTQLLLPSICVMEALSRLEKERKAHAEFAKKMTERTNEYQRGVAWKDRDARTSSLAQAKSDVDYMFGQFEQQLLNVILGAGNRPLGMFDLDQSMIEDALGNRWIADRTDNLILAAILGHTSLLGTITPKAFLSEDYAAFGTNREAKAAIQGAGIKYFRSAEACLGWLNTLPSSPSK